TLDDAGGTIQQKAVSLPWSAQTASHLETFQPGLPPEKAYFVRTATSKLASLVSTGSWRTIASVGVFSATTGLLLQRDDQGDTALANTASSEETCTTPTYATPPTSGVNTGMVNYPGRSTTVSVTTGGPIGRGACPAPTSSNTTADTLIYYD